MVLLIAVSICIAIDCIYGTVGAVLTHGFKSAKMRAGLLHKTAEFVVLALAYLAQWVLASGVSVEGYEQIQANVPTFAAVAVYIILMEVGSILELCVKYNPDLAGSRILAPFVGKHDKEDTDGR